MNSRTLMLRPRNLPLRLIKMEPQTPPKPPRLQQKKNTTMQSKCSKRQRTSRQRQRRSRQLRRRPRTSRRRTSLKMLVRSLRLRPSHSSRRLRKMEPQRKPKKASDEAVMEWHTAQDKLKDFMDGSSLLEDADEAGEEDQVEEGEEGEDEEDEEGEDEEGEEGEDEED